MPSDKDRLYVALYACGGAPVMPRLEDTRGARFHAKEKLRLVGTPPVPESVWEYEERESTMMPTSMLLVRVMIGKVKDRNRLESMGGNCVAWVKEAIETALRDEKVLGTPKTLHWDSIRDTAMWYVELKKAAHRFDGQGGFDLTKAATWDMLDGLERVP
ncbi:hypothetical protein C8A00DRAFT_40578 [Chaetomidium leptoderma]|uniref:Uncharacterized protein n=1 Tax=Chaetomidium leptoderma TaxID=669021 RepID=A0AAN6VSH5_9PEZI|nr:hypothetical protein C8A00DRAFT_40578 [Chaetomidium leptoderma]